MAGILDEQPPLARPDDQPFAARSDANLQIGLQVFNLINFDQRVPQPAQFTGRKGTHVHRLPIFEGFAGSAGQIGEGNRAHTWRGNWGWRGRAGIRDGK